MKLFEESRTDPAMCSAWVNEKITFGVAEPLAGMISRNEFPAGTVKWTADGLPSQNDVNTFDVQWTSPGLKHVNLQIGSAIFHLYVNVPDTLTLDYSGNPLNDASLILAIGSFSYGTISGAGLTAKNAVEITYGQTSGTGGTRQDAIRHSTWNAIGAALAGKTKMIIFSTANEHNGQFSKVALASNTTMDLFNNDVGATVGNSYFNSPNPLPNLMAQMELKFDAGDLRAWTPKNATVFQHSSIIKKSDETKIFAP